MLLLLERGSGGYRAQLELRDAGDRLLGERSLSSASSDCSALADSVALALALAAETFARAEARAAAPRPPPSPLTLHGVALAHPPQAPVPPPSSAAPRELEAQVGMGMLAGLGWHPSVNGGALLRAGVRWRLLSVNLEGRADLPVSTAVDNGTSARVATGFYGGSLSACLHWRFLGGCLAGHLAAFSAEGMNVDRPQQGTTVFAAVGARLLGTFDVAGPFSVQLALDLAAPVARPALWFDGRLSWQPPWVVGALGALAVLRFR